MSDLYQCHTSRNQVYTYIEKMRKKKNNSSLLNVTKQEIKSTNYNFYEKNETQKLTNIAALKDLKKNMLIKQISS